MMMAPERLAELDAVMAKVRAFPFGSEEWEVAFIPARLAAYNAYPGLRAHIDAQAATIARLREALQVIVDDYQTSPKHHPNDILIPIASFGLACAALTGAA